MQNNEFIDHYLEDIETLQEILMELNEESMNSSKDGLFALVIQNINESNDKYRNMFFKSLALHLIIASKMRPTKIKLIVELIIAIFQHETVTNSTNYIFIKTIILTTIFNSIKTDLTLSSQCTIVCLLHHFVRLDFFQMKQILSLYKNEKVTQNKGKKAIFTIFFCWFAPLIEREDKKLFCEMNENIFHYHDDINFGHSFKLFFDNIQKLKENNWELFDRYIEIEQNLNSVNEYIKNRDDENYLRDICANPNFKFCLSPSDGNNNEDFLLSSIIEPSIFEPSWIVQDRPTFIQFAAFFGSLKCFNYILLSMKQTFSNFLNQIQDEKKRNLITFAIAGGNIEIVRICEQNGVNLSDSLSIATQFYQHDIFDWIFESYDLHKKFDEGENIDLLTDIFCSAATSNNIKIAKWCIFDRHVDVNRKNLNGKNPLLLAAENGCFEIFQLILKNCKDVDINVTDNKYNKNCLHYACEHNHSEICELLLTLNGLQKIEYLHPGFRKMNALCLACKNGSVSCVRLLLRYVAENDVDRLVNSHADYSLATPLHLACWHGQKEIVNILIHEEEVDLMALMDDNRTCLHIAAENRHFEIVSLLINKENLLINMQDRAGYTALHLAACNNDIETVKVLLNSRLCDLNIYEKRILFFIFFFSCGISKFIFFI